MPGEKFTLKSDDLETTSDLGHQLHEVARNPVKLATDTILVTDWIR